MYAIIETGGKQFRVEKGLKLQVEKLPQEEGSTIEFGQVLLIGGEDGSPAKIGRPYIQGSKVVGTILRQFRSPKMIVFKKRSKKGYRKMQGHRQDLTQVQINDIQVS